MSQSRTRHSQHDLHFRRYNGVSSNDPINREKDKHFCKAHEVKVCRHTDGYNSESEFAALLRRGV